MSYSYKIAVSLSSSDQLSFEDDISELVSRYHELDTDFRIGEIHTSGPEGLGDGPTEEFVDFMADLTAGSNLKLYFIVYYRDCTNIAVFSAQNSHIDKIYDQNFESVEIGPLVMNVDFSESNVQNEITEEFMD